MKAFTFALAISLVFVLPAIGHKIHKRLLDLPKDPRAKDEASFNQSSLVKPIPTVTIAPDSILNETKILVTTGTQNDDLVMDSLTNAPEVLAHPFVEATDVHHYMNESDMESVTKGKTTEEAANDAIQATTDAVQATTDAVRTTTEAVQAAITDALQAFTDAVKTTTDAVLANADAVQTEKSQELTVKNTTAQPLISTLTKPIDIIKEDCTCFSILRPNSLRTSTKFENVTTSVLSEIESEIGMLFEFAAGLMPKQNETVRSDDQSNCTKNQTEQQNDVKVIEQELIPFMPQEGFFSVIFPQDTLVIQSESDEFGPFLPQLPQEVGGEKNSTVPVAETKEQNQNSSKLESGQDIKSDEDISDLA